MTTPRNAAPTTVRAIASGHRTARGDARGDEPDDADDRGNEIEGRRELGTAARRVLVRRV